MNQLALTLEPTYRALSPQQEALLPHLVSGWLTVAEALQRAGIYALSQRANEMSRMGYDIEKKWVDLPSGKRVMGYRIKP